MRLNDGTLWPIPITLDVTPELAERLEPGVRLALRDPEGAMLAALRVEEIWTIDGRRKQKRSMARWIQAHPGVDHLFHRTNTVGSGVRWKACNCRASRLPSLRLTPSELRLEFERLGWRHVVAFQTRNPLHRAHHALTSRAAEQSRWRLLLHPVAGMTRPGDIDHHTRVRCYKAVLPYYPPDE
jgi:sulfate adenylyltransferase